MYINKLTLHRQLYYNRLKTKYLVAILCISIVCVLLVLVKISPTQEIVSPEVDHIPEQPDKPDSATCLIHSPEPRIRRIIDSLRLVNIHDIDSTIGILLKYATTDNFTGRVLYEDIDGAYLQHDVAMMLAEAQQLLRKSNPGLRLLVYDAMRPLTVQQALWDAVKDTKYHRYVAQPGQTGLHNYGAAVDLTLADSLLQPLDMGTPFDYFGKAAGTLNEQELIDQGLLNVHQVRNRQLLRQVMWQAGFRSISGEWWHFNACSLSEAKQRYKLIDKI